MKIKIEKYNTNWPNIFEELKSKLIKKINDSNLKFVMYTNIKKTFQITKLFFRKP